MEATFSGAPAGRGNEQSEARRWPAPHLLAIIAVLAALHALLPAAVAWCVHRGGIGAGQLAVMAMHLFGPFVDWPLYRRVHLRWSQWGIVLLVNHAFVLLGAWPYLR